MLEHLCCCIGLITIDDIHCLPLLTQGNDLLHSQNYKQKKLKNLTMNVPGKEGVYLT